MHHVILQNPQVDLQAMDRCHRIGQTKPVMVYRFVSKGTVDEKILKMASGKRKLEKVVIKKGTKIIIFYLCDLLISRLDSCTQHLLELTPFDRLPQVRQSLIQVD